MKSPAEIIQQAISEKYKAIVELEAFLEQTSGEGYMSLSMGKTAIIDAQIQLSRMRGEHNALVNKYNQMIQQTEQELISGSKDDIIGILNQIDSDNSTYKLILLKEFENSSEES